MARTQERVDEVLDAAPDRISEVPLWYDVKARTFISMSKQDLAEHLERTNLPSDLAAISVAMREVTSRLEIADRMAEISTRLRLDASQLMAALEQLARQTPVEAADPSRALTAGEEAVLREAGSLRSSMPSFEERARIHRSGRSRSRFSKRSTSSK